MSKKKSKEAKRKAAQDVQESVERGVCELCGVERRLTKHHLICRAAHSKRRFREMYTLDEMRTRGCMCCKLCHDGIHDIIPDELVLAEFYNTRELLLGHDGIRKHIEWARKQKCI
jgi:hypothetical protein